NLLDQARDYNNLAHLYVWANKADSSLFYGRKGIEIVEADTEMIRLIPEIYLAMSHAYLALQNMQESNRYTDLYLDAMKKTFNVESAEAFRELEVQYETTKKEQALSESKLLIAEKTKERNLVVLFCVIGMLILILFFTNQ